MAATEPTAAPVGDDNPRLARNILSLPNCLALSAALMAPVLAVILNAPAGGADAGAALPLAFLIAFIAALFIGNTVIEFAKKLSSAGSFYSFLSQSLGSLSGFFSGWLYGGAYVVLMIGLVTANGAFLHTYLQTTFSVEHPVVGPGHHPGRDRDDLLRPQHQDVGPPRPDPAGARDLIFSLLGDHRDRPGRARQQPAPTSSRPRDRAASPASPWPWCSACCRSSASRRPPRSARRPRNPKRNVPLAVRFGALSGIGVFFVFVVYGLAAGLPPQHRRRAEGVPGQPDASSPRSPDATRPGSSSPSTSPPWPGCSPACSPC